MQRPNRSKSVAIILVVVFLLPVIYMLSVGPATWLYHHGHLGGDRVHAIYGPLILIRDWSPTCDAAMEWYLGWWHTPAMQQAR